MAGEKLKLKPLSEELVRNAPTSDEALMRLLSEGLDWPLGPAEEVDRRVFVNWDPEELDLNPDSVSRLETIQSIRPKDASQQFGVFLLKTKGGDLPIGALRRLLDSLVRRSRKSKTGAPIQFDMRDLLFVVSGEGGSREVHFAVFHEEEGRAASLRVISWGANETDDRIRRLANDQLPVLRWPAVNEQAEQWRENWLDVIRGGYREIPKTARQLALQMAEVAREIRDEVTRLMAVETEKGPTRTLFRQMKEQLIADLDAEKFADLYAQTIVYGLLAARIASQAEGEGVDEAHPFENVLLDTIYGRMSKEEADGVDLDQLGLQELNDYLATVDVAEILVSFGKEEQDPVIHFYEDFVEAYEPGRRLELGIFYTPTPVVRYIVRGVDRRLKEEFGLPMGVADATPWSEVADNLGIEIPEGADSAAPFVSMLDPATGTGTFLVEWIRQAELSFKEVAAAQDGLSGDALQAAWEEHLVEVVIPQMAAFELELASYSVAHLKVSSALPPAVRGHVRLPIYLTNALVEPGGVTLPTVYDPISAESVRVDEVKLGKSVSVVIGNPPYLASSSNTSDWAASLVDSYKLEPGGSLRLDEQRAWLDDDYVKFMAFAQKLIAASGAGISALVTNHGYIENVTFRGMRWNLLSEFDSVAVLDLHGNVDRRERGPDGAEEEPVFDIRRGVAICFAAQTGSKKEDDLAHLSHAELWGSRNDKFAALTSDAIEWREVKPKAPAFRFRTESELAGEYEEGIAVNELFHTSSQGIVTARDKVAMDPDREALLRRVKLMRDATKTDDEVRAALFGDRRPTKRYGAPGETRHFKLVKAREAISEEDIEGTVRQIEYRPFAPRWIYFSDHLVEWPRRAVADQFTLGTNLGLVVCRQAITDHWSHVMVVNRMIDSAIQQTNRGKASVFPLFTFDDTGGSDSNLNPETVCRLAGALSSDPEPIDVLDYVFGVLNSRAYQQRYSDPLSLDFPRVPVPESDQMFESFRDFGRELRPLFLLDASVVKASDVSFPVAGSGEVEEIRYEDGALWINSSQYFAQVHEEMWAARVGGYHVARRWLTDRRGGCLSREDISAFTAVLAALGQLEKCVAGNDPGAAIWA